MSSQSFVRAARNDGSHIFHHKARERDGGLWAGMGAASEGGAGDVWG